MRKYIVESYNKITFKTSRCPQALLSLQGFSILPSPMPYHYTTSTHERCRENSTLFTTKNGITVLPDHCNDDNRSFLTLNIRPQLDFGHIIELHLAKKLRFKTVPLLTRPSNMAFFFVQGSSCK
uniref:Uncharacterized protein n=1 Tax=Cacopsylla melanoneura TaxID=428564 RepID=A0A8D8PS99_9HEMI